MQKEFSKCLLSFVSSVVTYEALVTHLRGGIFHPHAKFQIAWIPFEMTGFHQQKFPEQW